ncbi:MAG TPA: VWA domain-containing protein [Myxococcota bacterium]|nr:VWA domain-containing protein [Myxococcota bacterium]
MSAAFWTHPEWLVPGVLAVALTALALGLARLALRRRRARLGAGIPLAPGPRGSDVALFAALSLLALALVGPRVGSRVQEIAGSGVDVVFAFDVSRSMDARDVAPSRLERARRAVAELLARLEPSDRAALAAFAGRGVLLTPLTPDRDALVELLDGIATGLVAPANTSIEEGLRAAQGAFEAGSERPRVVLLLGDGEDSLRRGDAGAGAALRADVRVLAAAFGTEVGATLDDHGAPLLDESGRPVVSRRNQERLRALVEATDGQLFTADGWGEIDLSAAMAAIRRDTGSGPGSKVARKVRAAPVVPLAALAFALLLFEGWLRAPLLASRRRTAQALAAGAAALVAAVPAPAGDELTSVTDLEADVRASPGDPHALIELGAARLERGQRDAASRAFLAAAVATRDRYSSGIAYFDLGVAALENGNYPAARDAFLDALALLPGDARARFNLEWTLQALQQHAPVANPEPPEKTEEEPKKAPAPPQQPEPEQRNAASEPEPPQLTQEEQQRWLARVQDDPGRALRAAARSQGGTPAPAGRRASGPAW